jgi:hypothetical protein
MKRLKGTMDLERWAPGLFVVIGLAMLVVAALDYLTSGVSGTFAILGTALIIFGGLLRSIEGVFKVGPQGIEATIKARTEIAAAVIEEKKDPDEAWALRAAMEWATDFHSTPARQGTARPKDITIARLRLDGRSTREIANLLNLSESSVDNAMQRIRHSGFASGRGMIIEPGEIEDLQRRLEAKRENIEEALGKMDRVLGDDDDDEPPAGAPAPR